MHLGAAHSRPKQQRGAVPHQARDDAHMQKGKRDAADSSPGQHFDPAASA